MDDTNPPQRRLSRLLALAPFLLVITGVVTLADRSG